MFGDVLTISQTFQSGQELNETIENIYFGLPSLLNTSLADPPYVERVDGSVGPRPFRWELSKSLCQKCRNLLSGGTRTPRRELLSWRYE